MIGGIEKEEQIADRWNEQISMKRRIGGIFVGMDEWKKWKKKRAETVSKKKKGKEEGEDWEWSWLEGYSW